MVGNVDHAVTDRAARGTDRFCCCRELLAPSCADGDMRALRREPCCDGGADSLAGSGDKGDPTVKTSHTDSPAAVAA
jgi:hypothetical protein